MEDFFKVLIVISAMVISIMCLALNATNKEIHILQQRVEALENTIQIQGGTE